MANPPVKAQSTDPKVAAVEGTNDKGGDGVVGNGRRSVVGISETFQGVFGKSVGKRQWRKWRSPTPP